MTTTDDPLPDPPVTVDALLGITVPQWQSVLDADPPVAAAWMHAAAQLGHADAQAVLGQWHLDGRGVERDPAQALHWFLRAAQLGHAMSMNMAGRCHEQGWGTPVDREKAAHWYRQAARTGLAEAQYNLGNLLLSGLGVARDAPRAFELYGSAAGQGYIKAFAKVARFHEDGEVVPRDAALAFDWYRRGAEGGDFRGQFCYAGLLAVQGRRAEALTWLNKVPSTATPRYLRQAGESLLQSPDEAFRKVGERMLELVGRNLAADRAFVVPS